MLPVNLQTSYGEVCLQTSGKSNKIRANAESSARARGRADRRGVDVEDGEHRERLNEILFIDARKMGEMVNRRLRVFSDEDVTRIANTYHQWRNKKGKYEDIQGFSKSANLEDVRANNYVLSPGRFVGTEAEEDDGIPFEEKMKGLETKLFEQFKESTRLEKEIRKNLKELIR